MTTVPLPTDDPRRLCRWYCELNCFEWPADFPAPKPAGYDDLPGRDRGDPGGPTKDSFVGPYTRAIRAAVSAREISRYWNVDSAAGGRTSPSEFEDWWEKNEGPVAAVDRTVFGHVRGALRGDTV